MFALSQGEQVGEVFSLKKKKKKKKKKEEEEEEEVILQTATKTNEQTKNRL